MARCYRQHLGPRFTEGSRQIWLRLAEREWGAEDLTRAARWGRGRASKYMYGDQDPDVGAVVTLRDLLGIEPSDFLRPPTRRFVPPAARAA